MCTQLSQMLDTIQKYQHFWHKYLRDVIHVENIFLIYSPTKVKHHLTCFNIIFSNNELISNRFGVFVSCTHILTYL